MNKTVLASLLLLGVPSMVRAQAPEPADHTVTAEHAGNRASAAQTGAGHSADITQSGSGNTATVIQHGSGNRSVVQQSGTGGTVTHEQDGIGRDATITQSGSPAGNVIIRQTPGG